jgi:hypothetical protein
MSDRELLELAAKAAGIQFSELGGGARYAPQPGIMQPYVPWNPLTNDGDALRLAATLGIDIEWRADGRVAAYRHANANGYCFTAFESSREDRAANVRRAIVRAAAEIGRNMK